MTASAQPGTGPATDRLILTGHALARSGGRLVVRGAQGVVRRCLEITGVLEHFGGASTNGTGP